MLAGFRLFVFVVVVDDYDDDDDDDDYAAAFRLILLSITLRLSWCIVP